MPEAPIQPVATSWVGDAVRSLDILRADLVDPELSGNKYYKLRYNLERARAEGHDTLVSFGGPWSNHLHALAAAGKRHGLRTIGVVRGEARQPLNPCLRDAAACGMHLHFVTRDDYRRRHEPAMLETLRAGFGPCFVIPEGGANREGILGCMELVPRALPRAYTHILLACGTGTTLAGIAAGQSTPVIGIQVLKGRGYLQREVHRLLSAHGFSARAPWQVLDDFHEGGYARSSTQLLEFMQAFTADTGIPLEPVYSGKLLHGVRKLCADAWFAPGSRLLLVHGGGLQGARGFDMNIKRI